MQRTVVGATLVSFLMIGALTGCATQSKALVSGNAAASASGNAAAQTQSGSKTQTASSTAGSGGSTTSSGSASAGAQGSGQAQTSVTAKGSSPNISTTQKTKAQATVNQMVKIVNQLH